MHNKVQNIHKNMRYKILNMNGEYYILDMTNSYWLLILPFLSWFISHKAYKIDKIMMKEIQTDKKGRTDVSAVATIATGFAVTMTVILRPIFRELNFHTSTVFNLTLLIITVLILILFRIFVHHKQWKRMKRHICLDDTPCIMLKVKAIKATFYTTYIFYYIFVWGIIFVAGHTFIYLGGVIGLVAALLVLNIALIMNFQSIREGEVQVVLMNNQTPYFYG